jgi:hypothetical protein
MFDLNLSLYVDAASVTYDNSGNRRLPSSLGPHFTELLFLAGLESLQLLFRLMAIVCLRGILHKTLFCYCILINFTSRKY